MEAKGQLFTAGHKKYIDDMIGSGKALADDANAERRAISKMIQKETKKRETRIQQSLQISTMLHELKDLKQISNRKFTNKFSHITLCVYALMHPGIQRS